MTHVIAHRGASAVCPENTLAAFKEARRMGADGVELDVRRTRDGLPAVHHDAELPDGRLIADLDAATLHPSIPMLDAALAECEGMIVNIEIKNVKVDPDFDPGQAMAMRVVERVESAGIADRVIVSSFGFAAIDRVHALDRKLRTAWLVADWGEPAALIDRAAVGGHAGIHPAWSMVDREFVDRAHDAGLFVNTWTVDDPDQIRRLADLGVDGIVTNVPDVALAVLGRSEPAGQAPPSK